jgi:3-oxoadipate enol-lactonase
MTGGAKPSVVLLHPLALSGEIWESWLPKLRDRFEPLPLDLRGHGSARWDGTPFTVDDMAADVIAELEARGITRTALVGASLGGCTAQLVAARRPDLVSALVLADTTAWYGPRAPASWAEREEYARSTPREVQLGFQRDRWFGGEVNGHQARSLTERIFADTDSAAHAEACRALGAFDARDRLPEISAPTLVITGDEDMATPPEMGRLLGESITGARFHLVPGGRHFCFLDRPEVAELAHAFLTETLNTEPTGTEEIAR